MLFRSQSIATKTGFSKKDAETALTSFVESVEESLVKGEKVTLVGFGTFEVKARAARTGVNPQTKEKIQIKASKAPAFRAGKDLKEKVNVKEKKAPVKAAKAAKAVKAEKAPVAEKKATKKK